MTLRLPIGQGPAGPKGDPGQAGPQGIPGPAGPPGASHVPPGIICDFAGQMAPDGYLLCDGAAVDRTTFAALYAVIGTTYGAGNGTTTFNVPDLRGRVSLGAGKGTNLSQRNLAATGGEEAHTMTLAEMPKHQHGFKGGLENRNWGGANIGSGSDHPLLAPQTTEYTGEGQPFNVMPPFLALTKIIKT